jgi:O-antigen/teichoic acid export membrane protein
MGEGRASLRRLIAAYVGLPEGSIKAACLSLWHRALASDFVGKLAETFATRILLIVLGMVSTVIIARILGPEGRGLYAVATAVGAIGVQFGNLGLHASNTYYVARDRKLLPALVGNTLVAGFGFGGLGALLLGVIFTLWPKLAPVHGFLLILALAWIPFGLAYLLFQNLLLGIHEVRDYNKIELFTKVFCVALIVLIIFLNFVSVITVLFATFITVILCFLWSFQRLRHHFQQPPSPSWALFKRNIRYGLKAYVAALFAFLVFRTNILMIQFMLGAEQSGYYSIASSIADMIVVIPVVVGTILFPRLSAMSNTREKWLFTKKVSVIIGFLMLSVVGVAALLASPVIRLLFGEAFMPAVPACVWLMPGIVILSINTCYMNFFGAIGMPMVVIYSPILGFVINILLNLLLIPSWGIAGASIAAVVAYCVMFLASLIYIHIFNQGYGVMIS